jgi:hypothetical protein
VALPFRDPFDQAMAGQGPPAVYTVDHKGQLGLNVERTRHAWQLAGGDLSSGVCHCLYRDHATGFVTYVLATSPGLCAAHPRADIARFDSEELALAALAALGAPSVWRGEWPIPPTPPVTA